MLVTNHNLQFVNKCNVEMEKFNLLMDKSATMEIKMTEMVVAQAVSYNLDIDVLALLILLVSLTLQ